MSSRLDKLVKEVDKRPFVPSFSLGKPPNISGDKAREVMIGNTRILFSYADPVGFRRGDIVRIDMKNHSSTTSRHRNAWIEDSDDIEILSHAEFQRQLAANLALELGDHRDTIYDIVGVSADFVELFADLVRRLRKVCVVADKLDMPFSRELTNILTDAFGRMMGFE